MGANPAGKDGLLCEKCNKWVHVACDTISPQQLHILRRPDFHYYCPVCRETHSGVQTVWVEQLSAIGEAMDERRQKDEEKRRRALLSQDFITDLFPPFASQLVPAPVGSECGQLLSSCFAVYLQPHYVQHLQGLSLLEQVELLKNGVRRVQMKRRRERRAFLLQQKRRRLSRLKGAADTKGRVWLLDDEADCDLALLPAEPPSEERRKAVQALMACCFPMLPAPNHKVHHVASHKASVVLLPPPPDSPEPVFPSDDPAMVDLPPLDSADASMPPAPTANGVSEAHAVVRAADADAIVVKLESAQPGAMTRPGAHRHRPPVKVVPSSVLTFASPASGMMSDPRACCFCHLPGDQTGPLSAGRLLPAHPFHPQLSFAHVQCVLWSSSPYGFVNELGHITGFFSCVARCFHSLCQVCQQPGGAIGCRHGKCRAAFHFHCAVASGCLFTSDMRTFCAEHADRVKKGSRHDIQPILRRMLLRMPRIEVKDGQVVGMVRAMESREAELAADGVRGRRTVKRKSKGQWSAAWAKRRKLKDEEKGGARDLKEEKEEKEEKREEGDADEDEEEDEDGSQLPAHVSNGENGPLPFPSSEPSRSSSPSDLNAVVKQEDAGMKDEHHATGSSPSPTPPDRIPASSYHLRIGALTIHQLGSASPLPGFHSSHFLYPEGYSASRLFPSYRRPHSRTSYHCFVSAQADKAQFHIVATDDEVNPIKADSPTTAFTSLMSRFRPPLTAHPASAALSGPYFFGFGLPLVLEQLEGFEAVESLRSYERLQSTRSASDAADGDEDLDRRREREREARDVEELRRAASTVVPINATGSARTEGYRGKGQAAKATAHKAGFSSSITSTAGSASPSPPPASSSLADAGQRRKALVDHPAQLSLSQQYRAMKASTTRARVGHSPIHEWGLYASEALEPGTMVIEYLGETIRQKVADVREKRYEEVGIGSCYMFRIDDDLIVDATKKGNIGRFINHSCDPCCVTKILEYGGEKKIVVITTRRVEVGEEITYDYFFANEADRIACNCGARNCAGRLN